MVPSARRLASGIFAEAEASLIEPVQLEDGARSRSDMLTVLSGALVSTAFLLGDVITGHFRETGWVFWSLFATTVLAWALLIIKPRGLLQVAWVLLTGSVALSTVGGMFTDLMAAQALSGVSIVLIWTGMMLAPHFNAVLVVFAVGMSAYLGRVVESLELIRNPGELTWPMLVAHTAVPLGIGGALWFHKRLIDREVSSNVERLQLERGRLVARLREKADELEMSREQLMMAQNLKTVGTMASGLAHELNNILTPIRGLAELIAQGASGEQSHRYGQRILDSAIAASQITSALLTYTRQGTFHPVRSNAKQLLQQQILPVLAKSLPGNVSLEVDLRASASVDVDRVLFQQAVANLLFNAVDAMPNGGAIRVTLDTTPRPASAEDEAATPTGDRRPRSAQIEVSDDGEGISTENLDQIFDPFFTTKAVGSGSGLGLAMVMGTVTRHGGRVFVDSTPGEGTTFTLLLPLAQSDDKARSLGFPQLDEEQAEKGPAVVVLTEDQDALDELEELLEATVCQPVCTSDAKAASMLLNEMGDRIDLLILDFDLEEADGGKLFRTVRELYPALPIILLSDEPTDAVVQRMIGVGPTRSVRKPMDPGLFATLMTDLLHPELAYAGDFTPVPIGTRPVGEAGSIDSRGR